MTPFKTCTCGRVYTRESWQALPPPRKGAIQYGVDGRPEVELRTCPCGSTMAVAMAPTVKPSC